MNENDIKCPYAVTIFTNPYCNKGRKPCGHHLDKQSIDQLQSKHPNKPFQCPVMGCSGQWELNTSEPDTKFMRKVEKFIALQEIGAANKKGENNTATLSDGEEDFTEI